MTRTGKGGPCLALGGSGRCAVGHRVVSGPPATFPLLEGRAAPELKLEWVRSPSAVLSQAVECAFRLEPFKEHRQRTKRLFSSVLGPDEKGLIKSALISLRLQEGDETTVSFPFYLMPYSL